MSPGARVRTAAAVATGLALLAAVLAGWGRPYWWALPLLTVAVAAAEITVAEINAGRRPWTFSGTEAAVAAAWLWAPGSWTVVAAMLGVAAACVVRRHPRRKMEYDIARRGAAVAAGTAVTVALGETVPAICAGLVAFWAVNHCLMALAVHLSSRRRKLRHLVRSNATRSALQSAGNASVGLLAAWLAQNAPLGLVGLLVPLALLRAAHSEAIRRTAEVSLFAELARGQERTAGSSIDASAKVVITAAARLFGGADVEMVLLAADGPVRFLGNEYGVSERRRVDSEAFDEPWVIRALGVRTVSIGVDDGRPYCSAVLARGDQPLAVLIARRYRGSIAFGKRDVLLAEVLVSQAESWLSVAELAARHADATDRAAAAGDAARALGDLGAHTVPSLVVLRESADRLAQLAAAPGGTSGIHDIVDELHMVEQAVASLLGAVALAAEPELVQSPEPSVPTQRRGPDWTTTGLLEPLEDLA